MDSELRKRVDLGLVLLAAIAGATAVTGSGTTDAATVAAGIVAGVLPIAVVLFVMTPAWAQDGTNS